MWPRTEEERRRQRNCGFVAFMNRADGQAAKDEMQGLVLLTSDRKELLFFHSFVCVHAFLVFEWQSV